MKPSGHNIEGLALHRVRDVLVEGCADDRIERRKTEPKNSVL
jgi:hypothetical protein